jgi:hypothetical protein
MFETVKLTYPEPGYIFLSNWSAVNCVIPCTKTL